jgi:hypothetical protein
LEATAAARGSFCADVRSLYVRGCYQQEPPCAAAMIAVCGPSGQCRWLLRTPLRPRLCISFASTFNIPSISLFWTALMQQVQLGGMAAPWQRCVRCSLVHPSQPTLAVASPFAMHSVISPYVLSLSLSLSLSLLGHHTAGVGWWLLVTRLQTHTGPLR